MSDESSPGIESRVITGPAPEIRASEGEGGGPGILVHHAPPWDTESELLWHEWVGDRRLPVYERFRRGAFAGILGSSDVRALRDHARRSLLGRTRAGTLRVVEDDVGLRYEVDLPDTELGKDTAEAVRRKDLTGSSFSFRAAEDGEDWDVQDERIVRTVTKVELLVDVGPVCFPAYPDGPQGDASLRGLSARSVLEAARRSLKSYLEGRGGHVVDRDDLIRRAYQTF